jgi:hypothetical protein
MEDEKRSAQFHSRSVDAAAARHGERHPEDDPEHPPPSHVPEPDGEVPGRHSASAEAASLRWREQNLDEE